MESPIEPYKKQQAPAESPQTLENVIVRLATEQDVPAIARIYNQGIEDRIATVETRQQRVEEVLEWFKTHGSQEPVIVAEREGEVVGWAALSRFSHRRAYEGIKELSIYMERNWRGKGIGTRLLGQLIGMAQQSEIYKIVLNAMPVNRTAISLYRKFGFRTVGVWKNQGKVDNRWVDMLLMEKHLSPPKARSLAKDSQKKQEINLTLVKEAPRSSTVVVKIGGSTLGEHDTTLDNLVALQKKGIIPVVVHGGGKIITDWMSKQGIMPTFVKGLRVTDAASLQIVVAVLTGLINKELVAAIISRGGKAVGISGVDGGLLQAKMADPALGLVGRIEKVNPEPILQVLDGGAIPVIAPVALHLHDDNEPNKDTAMLNINADTAAGEIARALGSSQLVFLTDVPGVMDSSRRVLRRLTRQQAASLIQSGTASGGMTPKIEACLRALERVPVAHIIDGRKPGALLESFEGRVTGTTIR